MDLSASPLTTELPRPFIVACLVSLVVHAGMAGWYALDTGTTVAQLPRPTLHVKVRAVRERVSLASTMKPAHDVVRQTSRRREPPPVVASPLIRRADRHEKTPAPKHIDNVEPVLPVLETREMTRPARVAVAVVESQPAYSPPSCSSAALNNPKPDYPRIALRRGIEGLVLLHVEVSEQGHPVAVRVRKSAGFKPLDVAALRAVRRWRFLPAQRNGVTVRAAVEVPVRFRLDEAGHSDS
ncbi:MAG: TonB family protein [Thiogranum sp.]